MQIAIDKVYFKEILLRDKRFLYDLYQNNKLQNQNQIVGANEFHLDTLIKIFHLILNNTIPILEQNFEKVKNARKVSLFKKHFKSNKDFLQMLQASREEKVFILKKFSALFCNILAALFEE
jgi:hypothetical protein